MAQHLSCLHLFRHLAPNLLENRQVYGAHLIQSDEKSDGAIQASDLISASLKATQHKDRLKVAGAHIVLETKHISQHD